MSCWGSQRPCGVAASLTLHGTPWAYFWRKRAGAASEQTASHTSGSWGTCTGERKKEKQSRKVWITTVKERITKSLRHVSVISYHQLWAHDASLTLTLPTSKMLTCSWCGWFKKKNHAHKDALILQIFWDNKVIVWHVFIHVQFVHKKLMPFQFWITVNA